MQPSISCQMAASSASRRAIITHRPLPTGNNGRKAYNHSLVKKANLLSCWKRLSIYHRRQHSDQARLMHCLSGGASPWIAALEEMRALVYQNRPASGGGMTTEEAEWKRWRIAGVPCGENDSVYRICRWALKLQARRLAFVSSYRRVFVSVWRNISSASYRRASATASYTSSSSIE